MSPMKSGKEVKYIKHLHDFFGCPSEVRLNGNDNIAYFIVRYIQLDFTRFGVITQILKNHSGVFSVWL